MTSHRKFLFFLSAAIVLYGHVIFQHHAHAQDGDEDAGASDEGNVTEGMKCFACNASEECGVEQEEGTHADETCADGMQCWTWKTENDGVESYRRGCSDACTDETKELSCQNTANRTDCSKCCSDSLCNDDLLNGAISRMTKSSTLLMFSTVAALIFAVSA